MDTHSNYVTAFLVVAYFAMLLVHLVRNTRDRFMLVLSGLVSFATFGIFVVRFFDQSITIGFFEFAGQMLVYGMVLYVFIGESLLWGIAARLTRWRGEKWVKELDYIYLLLGAVGILGSVNRLEFVAGRFSRADLFGPLILTTAIVIRLIKTRADIGGWNKLTSEGVAPFKARGEC
jgi:hypothetical protein